jgi:hypothetical protein
MGLFILSISLYFALSYFQIMFVATPEFDTYNYLYKLFYIMMCITQIELKYISVWGLAMIGMKASGITYNPSKNVVGKDGIVEYNFNKIEANGMK